MANSNKKFIEGDWFAVPLGSEEYGIGIVARKSRSIILAGFFFGPIYKELPSLEEISSYTPSDSILSCRFGSLGLDAGEWPVIGKMSNWDRAKWALNIFTTPIPFTSKATVYEYADNNPAKCIKVTTADFNQVMHLPSGGAMGHIFVQERLSSLLASNSKVTKLIDDRIEIPVSKFFEEDVAADIRGDFLETIRSKETPEVAAEKVLKDWKESIDDTDDGPVIYLALACLLLDKGVKRHYVLDKARSIIENKEGLGRWSNSSEGLAARLAEYDMIAKKLKP